MREMGRWDRLQIAALGWAIAMGPEATKWAWRAWQPLGVLVGLGVLCLLWSAWRWVFRADY